MVKFVVLNPDGDCSEANIQLKGKDLEKDVATILRKRCEDPSCPKATNTKPKTVLLINTIIKNIGETKLEEIAQWRLSDDYKLIGYGFREKKTKRKFSKKTEGSDTLKQNGHELPPCKNATNVYMGDIVVFKINSKQQILDYTIEDYTSNYQDLFFRDEFSDSSDDEDNFDDIDTDLELGEDDDQPDNPSTMFKNDDFDGEETDDIDYGDGEDDGDAEYSDDNENDDDGDIVVDTHINEDGDDDVEVGVDVELVPKKKKKDKEIIVGDAEIPDIELEANPIDEQDDLLEEEDENLDTLVEYRQKVIDLFQTIVKPPKVVNRIEASIFKATCQLAQDRKVIRKWDNLVFKKIYINKSRSLFTNLKKDSYVGNVKLAEKIGSRRFDLDNIAFMTYQELFPEHWKKLLDEKYKREKVMYEDKAEAMTDQFKCGR